MKKTFFSALAAIALVVSSLQFAFAVPPERQLPLTNASGGIELLEYNYVDKTATVSVFEQPQLQQFGNSVLGGSSTIGASTSAYNPGLPDANDLITPYSIIGTDDRVKVSPSSFPYSAVMFLYLGQDTTGNGIANSWGSGSGFMEGPDVMATAAHCMWAGSPYGWVEEMRVFKQQNAASLGSTYYYPLSWSIPTAYANSLDYNYDWCVVTLQNNLGDAVGWFGKGWSSGSLNGKSISVSGYPGDKLYYQYKAPGTIQSTDSCNVTYNADTMAGQSGCPVYDSSHTVWAINTYSGGSFNQGNKITQQLYDILQAKYLEGMDKWH